MTKTCRVKKSAKLASLVCFCVFSFSSHAQNFRQTSFDSRSSCEQAKGTWRQFGNSCADECEAKFDQFAICSREIIYACECGKSRCFDGETCVAASDYKKKFDEKRLAEQKILDEAKEKRRGAALENQQKILTKFSIKTNQPQNDLQQNLDQNQVNENLINQPQVQVMQPRQEASQQSIIQPAKNQNAEQPNQPQNQQEKREDKALDQKPQPVENLTIPGLPVIPLPN